MMELLVAILLGLGSLTGSSDDYIYSEDEVSIAQQIIDNGQYRIDEATGGVIIEPGVGL